MKYTRKRSGKAALRCMLCGQAILPGEEYWACSGLLSCGECFPELARRELAPCREIRGREARP